MQAEQTQTAAEQPDTFERNHSTLLGVLRRPRYAQTDELVETQLGMHLERVLLDHATGTLVPFDGDTGIEALLKQLGRQLPTLAEERHDGRLMGLHGTLELPGNEGLAVSIELGAGGQVCYSVGPSASIVTLLGAFESLDRQLHVAARELGCDYLLLAEGYNPLADSPLDVSLVPRTRWTLLNAHLSQTGRYARDMMRCACATHISLEYSSDQDTIEAYKLAVALSPLFMFLTDNVRSFRGSGARRCPRMVRSIMWNEVDPTRCGVVPGTFDEDFSYETYLSWLEGVQSILFVDALGTTSSTGKKTTGEVMSERVLSAGEVLGLFRSVLPYVRLGRNMELLQADALRPRMAAGYAAFVKGILCSRLSTGSAWSLLGKVSEEDVELAAHELRVRGWDATVYGKGVSQLVGELLQIARSALDDAYERRILDEIAEQWEVCMVPRDAFVTQEIRAERGW